MKKLFASLMAATMVAGMSVSAFAYTDKVGNTTLATAVDVNVNEDDDDDFDFVKVTGTKTVHGGDKIRIPILVNVKEVEDDDALPSGYFYATKASEVKDLKASVKETQGKGAIKEVNIVRKAAADFGVKGVSGKIYGIEVKLNDYFKDEKDLEFDLTLKNKSKEMSKQEDVFFRLGQDDSNSTLKGEAALAKDTADNKIKPYTLNAKGEKDFTDITAKGKEWEKGAKVVVDANGKVTADGTAAGIVLAKDVNDGYGFGYDAKFKNDCLDLVVGKNTKLVTLDEWTNGDKIEEIYMETADGEMIVEGYLEEQDPLFLEFTTEATDFQKAVMVENNDADVDTFVWSAHPTFDFSMDVRVPVEDDRDNFLYEVIDGKLVEVDAELNEDGDELTFKTKTLGEYLLSDKQLTAEKTEAALAEKAEAKEDAAKEDGVKENSETGAAIAVATVIALF